MKDGFYLGIDIGSVAVKTAVLSSDGDILSTSYNRIKGDPISTLFNTLSELSRTYEHAKIKSAGVTGSGGREVASALGALFTNEVICQAAFAERFYPGARTIIELGGQDAKLISLIWNDAAQRIRIEDFSMNTACAAGTGSFLDQQASRLRLTIEEFGRIALKSERPPAVAGRCSVFAKSDMIHLQQIATPDHDIVAGLCFAVARNFKSTIGKGRPFTPPILFLGGVAANLGMQRAFREVLGIETEGLIIPELHSVSAAIGAALSAMQKKEPKTGYRGLSGLELFIQNNREDQNGREPLSQPSEAVYGPVFSISHGAVIDAYLGVDVGSVSTNVVVIDKNGRVLSKRYLPTAGRPIEAVQQGLSEIGREIGSSVRIAGAGTTGSGRYLTGDMIGADIIRNEITCQATAAAFFDPEVDTIFEIGGQDSKYISLHNGAVVDFEMNKSCAAGTGSFLEEQAERLGISIKDEFAERAFRSENPCRLGERCTVFMESDLVHFLNKGARVDDISAGLAYSIAENYLNKVVAGKRIGKRIFFQGGVASNRAVVAAFEKILGLPITVPPHHEVTGAIGAALIAMRRASGGESRFKGFSVADRRYSVSTFTCRECSNQCDIRRVTFGAEPPLFYGSRCEKYDVKRGPSSTAIQDLFGERENLIAGSGNIPDNQSGPVVGIPRMFYLNDYLPFWKTFFSALGFRVLLSGRTNRTIINAGIEAASAELCFPSKAALGHILDLLEKRPDYLFIPSFIRLTTDIIINAKKGSQACPYIQAAPYLAKATLSFGATKILEPRLYLHDRRWFLRGLEPLFKTLGIKRSAANRALERASEAQAAFERSLSEAGERALSSIGPHSRALVIIGRSYNALDTGMNMNLPAKIRDLGVQAIPMDYLPLSNVEMTGWEGMYWRSGQRILKAARFIKDHPYLHPVYIGNFGCGPDSFIYHFFRQEMGDKPFLHLELDEHSADAGVITRVEAFLDSIANAGQKRRFTPLISKQSDVRRRKLYIHAMSDHVHALAAAFRACDIEACVLPESDEETVRLGKEYSSGRECFPLSLTVGDMIKATKMPGFDPEKSAFFMPGGKGPCRFGQYRHYHKQVLERIGLAGVQIYSPVQDETLYREVKGLGRDFIRLAWRGALYVDLLQKLLWEHRPYEKRRGESDSLYIASLERLIKAIERRMDLLPILRQAQRDFSSIEITKRDRPVIGIVGEIYIRSNRFSNEDIVKKIEQLGGEAWVAPVSEWLLYLTETAKVSARMGRSWRDLLWAYITEKIQHRDEDLFLAALDGTLRSLHEPRIKETLSYALPYIHHSLEGEAVLTVGKAIDYIKKGVSGIVNVMPLTCMPGTISTVLLKRMRDVHGNIPLLSISYDGQKDSQILDRLEAFMQQARQYHAGQI